MLTHINHDKLLGYLVSLWHCIKTKKLHATKFFLKIQQLLDQSWNSPPSMEHTGSLSWSQECAIEPHPRWIQCTCMHTGMLSLPLSLTCTHAHAQLFCCHRPLEGVWAHKPHL